MTQVAAPVSRQGGELWLIPRETYRRMVDEGMLEGERVELIRGRILNMAPMGLPHGAALMRATEAIRDVFTRDRFTVRSQMQFEAADDSDPEPDLCVVSGSPRQQVGHPDRALLVIEISDSSLFYDRNVKGPLYAESGVADYWIINLIDNVVEIYRNPHQLPAGEWTYDAPIIRSVGQSIDVLALPGVSVKPEDLLP